MDAPPIYALLARALDELGLEAILTGNAAAALYGPSVTAVRFSFVFRKTPANVTKLKALARRLHAVAFETYYPGTGLFRLQRDEDLLQVDFMNGINGVCSLEGLRRRAVRMDFGGRGLLVAGSADTMIPATPKWQRQPMKKRKRRMTKHEALALESERVLRERIRALLAKPTNERTHFLRRKIGFTGSCL